MPKGERVILTGLLLLAGRALILRMDDCEEWRLETNRSYAKLVGRRVTVSGFRDEFDLVAVSRIDLP
jgi:hypothetical protein